MLFSNKLIRKEAIYFVYPQLFVSLINMLLENKTYIISKYTRYTVTTPTGRRAGEQEIMLFSKVNSQTS